MIANDQRGSAGGGANMIASSFRFSDVRWSGGGGGGPVSMGPSGARSGGQVEQKMFRFRISSICFVYTGPAAAAGARSAVFGGGPTVTSFRSTAVAVARARKIMHRARTRPSTAQRYLRSSVSTVQGSHKATPGPCPARINTHEYD